MYFRHLKYNRRRSDISQILNMVIVYWRNGTKHTITLRDPGFDDRENYCRKCMKNYNNSRVLEVTAASLYKYERVIVNSQSKAPAMKEHRCDRALAN